MGDYHHLPILPASSSLSSHLQALDLLAARLHSLNTQAEWETRVPLNSKASVKGAIVNTANVKINIGGEWWVNMTPLEGEEWVRRRKTALLEEHAKVLEGWRPGMTARQSETSESPSKMPITSFDPVFRSPVSPKQPVSEMTIERPKEPEASKPVIEETVPGPPDPSSEFSPPLKNQVTEKPSKSTQSPKVNAKERGSRLKNEITERSITSTDQSKAAVNAVTKRSSDSPLKNEIKGKLKEVIPEIPRTTSTAGNPKNPAEMPQTLANVLSQFMESQNALAQATGSGAIPSATGDVMVNEEGLPIHEIREDENGKLLGDLPAPIIDGEAQITRVDEKDDFWSAAAVARREALRRKVFDDPSDSESEDSDTEVTTSQSVTSQSPAPTINAIPPTPTSPNDPLNPHTTRRPSTSSVQPKSILKSSTPRKKSVSFDSSIPEAPDSPATTRIGGSTFPHPIINIEKGIEEREVPVLNAPKRSPKQSTPAEPFAGFKAGFLGGKSISKPTAAVPATSTDTSQAQVTPVAKDQPRKKSLFAQRAESAGLEEENKPNFPPMSTATHTSSVKNTIIERPPPEAGPGRPSASMSASKKDRVEGKTAGVSSTVVERPVHNPEAGPSRLTSRLPSDQNHDQEQEHEYDEDDEEDDDFYNDVDDDEYDLDDALLAREVALAYHQNRAYSQLGQQQAQSNRLTDESAEGFDESYVDGYGSQDEEEEEGGVVLGLPQIVMPSNTSGDGSGQRQMPSIINPTPDNLRRFVRVGKLDNGKLVLAPGEDGWSDEEEVAGGEGSKNREEIKAALLGRGPSGSGSASGSGAASGSGLGAGERRGERKGDGGIVMPPVVESAGPASVVATTAAVRGVVQERPTSDKPSDPVAPSKKVSRFKAARMG